MEPSFLLIYIVESTFHHLVNQMVPLSLQNGKRLASFPFVSISILIFSYENWYLKFNASLSANSSQISHTQFSNLSFFPPISC